MSCNCDSRTELEEAIDDDDGNLGFLSFEIERERLLHREKFERRKSR